MSKYDWGSFPTHTIEIGKLSQPYDICKYFAFHGIDKYVYRIVFQDKARDEDALLKYGMSAAKSYSRDWGERLYRQLAHCYSWGPLRIDGSSGADWVIIERDYFMKYGVPVTHSNLIATVWDVTNYEFQSFDPGKEVEDMEREKIEEYILQYGEKPIGNINDESNKRHRTYVPKNTFNNLFD
jgi:hypothetical protein